ncbi:MAG: 2-oxoacid:acceptor oxidoreductase family protein [Candidatus Zixiibacteriota bacterium]
MRRAICNIQTDNFEIRLSGSGGQGLISAGVVLAEAIGIGDGKNVVQAQSYGPEARGGATRCDVIISDTEIYFPECTKFDILLCLTQEAYDKYANDLKPEGIMIIDEHDVEALSDFDIVEVPFIKSATDDLKAKIVANIIALGFIAQFTKVVTKKSLKQSVVNRFEGTKHLDLNDKALELGYKLAKKAQKEREKKMKRK